MVKKVIYVIISVLLFLSIINIYQLSHKKIPYLIMNVTKTNPLKWRQYILVLLYSDKLSKTILLSRPMYQNKKENKYFYLEDSYNQIITYNDHIFLHGDGPTLKLNEDATFGVTSALIPKEYIIDFNYEEGYRISNPVKIDKCNKDYSSVYVPHAHFEIESYKVISVVTVCVDD